MLVELAAVPGARGHCGENPLGDLCRPLLPLPTSWPAVGVEEGEWKETPPPSISKAAARFLRVRRGLPPQPGASSAEVQADDVPALPTAAPLAAVDALGFTAAAAAAVAAPLCSTERELAGLRTTLTVRRTRCLARNVPLKDGTSDCTVLLLAKVLTQLFMGSPSLPSLETPKGEQLPSRRPKQSSAPPGELCGPASPPPPEAPGAEALLRHAAAARAAQRASSIVA